MENELNKINDNHKKIDRSFINLQSTCRISFTTAERLFQTSHISTKESRKINQCLRSISVALYSVNEKFQLDSNVRPLFTSGLILENDLIKALH